MGPRTRLVAVTATSNILGTVNPIAEIAARVHAGRTVCVDAVAYAPHRAIDVQAWNVDYLFFSIYKVFGSHFAALYGRYEALLELDGLHHWFYGKDRVPMKLDPATPAATNSRSHRRRFPTTSPPSAPNSATAAGARAHRDRVRRDHAP